MLCNDFLWRRPSRWMPFGLFFRGTHENGSHGGTMTSITRRSVLRGAIAMAAGAFAGRTVLTPIRVFAQARPGASAEGVKALVYDVLGTCTGWRNGVARDAERILKPAAYHLCWHAFAGAWRALDQPSSAELRSRRQ